MSHIFNLKDVKSPWNGEYYIGFVLDVVNKYLDWRSDYYLPGEHGDLSKVNRMSMVRWDSERLVIDRIRVRRGLRDGEVYCLEGFPNGRFPDFKENAQDLWNSHYAELFQDYYDSLNQEARDRLQGNGRQAKF